MISLAECAPCKAMRLQAEANEEFKKRFGVVNAAPAPAPAPAMMGWRPYMGQATAKFPATGTPPPIPPTYWDQVGERMLNFAGGTVFGFPFGIMYKAAFKSERKHRNEAMMFAAMASGVGLVSALLPIQSPIMNSLARVAGLLAGGAAADIMLPKKVVPPIPA